MSLRLRKAIFLGLMLASYVPVFFFAKYVYLTDGTGAVKLVASICGMTGVMLLTWQYLMGVRGLVSKFVPDLLWVNGIHKLTGKYGFIFIFLHPILMTIWYASVGVNLINPSLATTFDQYRFLGEIGFGIVCVTWFASAIIRNRISFRWWKRIHVFNLVVLPLLLLHSLTIGTTLLSTNLRYYWYAIGVVVILILIYRFILFKFFGFGRLEYTVTGVHKIAPDAVQIDMSPSGKAIVPQPGQFIYIRPLTGSETHPFTLSHFNPDTKEISVSPKCSGPFSCDIQNIQLYTKVWVDGPYGVFTKEAYTTGRPLVLIAGGIGITPFVRLLEKLQQGWQKQVYFFYANQTEADVAYTDLLAAVTAANPQFKLVNVMSRQEDYSGEKGHINSEMIKKYVNENIADYDFFVCGPPPMMKAVSADLIAGGVSKQQIYSERFSL